MSEVKKIATRESYGNALAELGAQYKDLVVLDADPMTITPEDIRHIQVLATIKEGKIIYQADDVECVDCIND